VLRFRVSGDSVFGSFTTEPITAMAALKIRADLSSEELRRLTRGESDGRVCRRLLALAMALDGVSREEAARQAGMQDRLYRMKLSFLTPRPIHPKTDAAAQETFKKLR
jgi:hypothetical protein